MRDQAPNFIQCGDTSGHGSSNSFPRLPVSPNDLGAFRATNLRFLPEDDQTRRRFTD